MDDSSVPGFVMSAKVTALNKADKNHYLTTITRLNTERGRVTIK